MNRRFLRDLAIYGACGGILIAVLRLIQYRFLVIDHSFEVYAAIVAALFAALGIWLGGTLTRKKPEVVVKEVPVEVRVGGPFVLNEARLRELQITPRELEILGWIAEGLTNKEIAERAFVSENTVKTHASRVFDKLGARRRTEAVQLAKTSGLIP